MKQDVLSLQLYTVRDRMAEDFAGTMRKVAEIGYGGVEIAGDGGLSASEMNSLLKSCGLIPVGSHIGIKVFNENFDEMAEYQHEIGNRYVTLPHIDIKSLDDAKNAAGILNGIGRRCSDAGLVFSYHNHDFEFRSYDGRIAYDVLLEETDPSYVFFQMDTCWVRFGGYDPCDYIRKYPRRFITAHIKDMNIIDGKAVQTEVGKGIMDFRSIIPLLEEYGTEYLIIENDTCSIPTLESAAISLRNMGVFINTNMI